MNLLEDWHIVVKKAWSFRLAIAAGVLSALTVIMGVFVSCGSSPMFMVGFTLVSVAASVAGFAAAAARVTAQPRMRT